MECKNYIWGNFCKNSAIFCFDSEEFSLRTPDVSVTITSSDLAGVLQGTLSPLQVEIVGQNSSHNLFVYPGVPDRSNLSAG